MLNMSNITVSNMILLLPFSKSRTRAIDRVGPHDFEVLSVIVSSMLGDKWSNIIPGKTLPSVSLFALEIDQSVVHSSYIHSLTLYFYEKGYCASFSPKIIKKSNSSSRSFPPFNKRESLYINELQGGKIIFTRSAAVKKKRSTRQRGK